MNNKKFNKELLNEEIKRFQQINEFQFLPDKEYESDIEDRKKEADKLLYSDTVYEAEDEETSDDVSANDETGDTESGFGDEELPSDEENVSADEEPSEDGGFSDDEGGFGDDEGGFDDEIVEDPMDDAVELDVTELVKGSEEAKASADEANSKISQLMGMVDKLEGQLNGMSQISQKIDNLESEIEKRNPTEDEKLEMRSLDSYPYNLKLTDFWSNQTDKYDVMGTEEKEEEFELNRDSIDKDYVETDVRDSFDIDLSSEEDA